MPASDHEEKQTHGVRWAGVRVLVGLSTSLLLPVKLAHTGPPEVCVCVCACGCVCVCTTEARLQNA